MSADDSLPDDIITLKAMVRAERAARLAAEAEAQARTLLIEKLQDHDQEAAARTVWAILGAWLIARSA
jgi:hypothetical protein